MKITIETTDEIGASILKFVSALETVAKNPDDIQVKFDMKETKVKGDGASAGRSTGARVQYRPILPTKKKEREDVIKSNLMALGEGKLKAIIYREMTEMAQRGEQITKRGIMDACKITVASTAEREIGDLCRMKIVAAEPIVNKQA